MIPMRRFADRTAWMRARAVNTLRRPLTIAAVGVTFAAAVLIALAFVPRQATRAATTVTAAIPPRPDSTPTLRTREQAIARITAADSIIAIGRREAAAPIPVQPVYVLPPELVPQRDSLVALISALNVLIGRAETAPLASSYRALGESPLLAGSPGVRAMVDSLIALERERESFGAVSGVDPVYIALTARANAIGRSIVAMARQRRGELRSQLAPLLPPPPPPRPRVTVDTLRALAERANAQPYLLTANQELARIRDRNAEIDELEQRARELREVGASLSAMMGAALIVGLALGFAVTLFAEMKRPRISDVREAERHAEVRVLAVVQPRIIVADRSRRRADREVPGVLDPFGEHYRRIYLQLTTRDVPLSKVTVTGDEADVAAVVGLNLAAYDVREARSALVVDTDPVTSSVARALEIPNEPGLTSVLAGTASTSDATVYVPVGRDQILAVIPSGRRAGRPTGGRVEKVRSDLDRLAARHDLIVFVAAVARAKDDPTTGLLTRDVVVCARLGHTRIRTLDAMLERLRGAGMTVHGLVLWNAEPVRLRPVRTEARARRREPELAPLPA
jgi:Mrp family chromosome partitioning ATPase